MLAPLGRGGRLPHANKWRLHHRLLRRLLSDRTLELFRRCPRLDAHDATAPSALNLLGILIVLLAHGSHNLAEVVAILSKREANREYRYLLRGIGC